MSTPENDMVEVNGFYTWQAYDSEGEKKAETIMLPTHPDNCGWFVVGLPDGTKYTIYDIETMIDKFHNRSDVVEPYSENKSIHFNRNLVELIEKNKDKTPDQLAEVLTSYYELSDKE